MLFKDIVDKFDWASIENRFFEIYPDMNHNGETFDNVLKTLKALSLETTEESITLLIVHITEDYTKKSVDYHEVTGFNIKDKQHFGIAFMSWEKWLTMEIHQNTLENYDHEGILIHSLWEMTYYGFTQTDILKEREGSENEDEFKTITLSNGLEINIPLAMFEGEDEATNAFIAKLEQFSGTKEELLKKIKEGQDFLIE